MPSWATRRMVCPIASSASIHFRANSSALSNSLPLNGVLAGRPPEPRRDPAAGSLREQGFHRGRRDKRVAGLR